MEPQPSSSREITSSDAPASSGTRDPLDVVTEFDVRALAQPCGVFRGTQADGIARVNQHFLDITGLSPAAARGWDWLVAVHSEDRDRLQRAIDAACRTGAGSVFPIRVQVRLGVIETLRASVMAVPVPTDGWVTGADEWVFVGAVEPEAAPAPRSRPMESAGAESASSNPYEVVLDALPIPTAYVAPDGVIEFANPAWSDAIGPGVDANVAELSELGADDADGFTAALADARAWSGTRSLHGWIVDVTLAPISEPFGGGHVITVQTSNADTGSDRDVPQPAHSVSSLEVCFALLDASPDFATVFTPAGLLLHANPMARRLLGFTRDEPVDGKPLLDFVSFDDHTDDLSERMWAALDTAGSMKTAGDVVSPDGSRHPVAVMLFAVKDDEGGVEAVVCIARGDADLARAEQQLFERERWYRAMVQHNSDVVCVLDADLRVTYSSPSAAKVYGVAAEDVIGQPFLGLVEADDHSVVTDAIELARSSGEPVTVRYRGPGPSDTERVLETRVEDLLADPIIRGLVLNTRDVTDAEFESQARDRSEAAFRAVVRSAPAAIYAIDVQGDIQLWNPACEALFGWSAAEVIGRPPPFLTDGQRSEAITRRSSLLAGEEISGEAKFVRRDGSPIAVGLSVAPIVARDGTVTSVITVALDLTERIDATERLEQRAEIDRTIAALSRSLVDATSATLDDCTSEVLRTLAGQYGATGAALFLGGVDDAIATWPADVDFSGCPSVTELPAGPFTVAGTDRGTIAAGCVMTGEGRMLGVVALRWDAPSTVRDTDLETLDIIGAAMIAARQRVDAEEAVRTSDLRFRTLAEHSTDLVMVVGVDLQPEYVSPAASRFLGIAEGDRFDPGTSVIHAEDRDLVRSQMAAIAVAERGARTDPIVARFLRVDSEYRWVEMVVTNLLDDPVVGGLVLNARDITQRRNAEEQLRHSESRFRGLVQNLAEGVIVLAADGSVKYSSPSSERMMGFEVGHGEGRLGLDFVVEEDRDRVAEVVAKAFSEPGIQGPITLRVRAADGEILVVEALGHNRLDDPEVQGVVVTTRDITEKVAAEESARRSDARLSALVENLSDVVTIVDAGGQLVYTSPAANTLFGFEQGDESWTDPMARMHPDDVEEAIEALGRHVESGSHEPVRFRLRAADGTWRSVEAIARDMTGDPDVAGIVVTTRDISARTRAENLLADQAKVLTLIARGAPLASTLGALCDVLERNVDDAVCGFLLVDQSRQRLRLAAGPRIPMEIADACHDIPIGGTEDVFGATAALGSTAVILDIADDPRAESLRAAAGRCGVAGIWSTPIFDSLAQRVIGTLAMFFDTPREPTTAEREVVQMFSQTAAIAIERQVAEDLLAHRANHDSLTGLPNRVLFLEFLSRALARSGREQSGLAVLFLDLDRFKHINDGLGHDAGDEVLRELGRRLELSMRPSDVVARFGGDEFTVLCEGLDTSRADQHVAEVARRLLDVVEQPLSVGGEDRRLSASLGIAIATPDSTPDGLLRDADAAMYEAKERGKARWEVFDDDMRSSMTARLDLESKLERAIEREEFRLFLQPIIDLATGRCVGAEALLRWHDPEIGLVTPDAFIGLAEETGLIIPIGEWALAEACRTVARWEEVGLLSPEFTMAVNLSARQVAQADLADKVRAVIAQSGPMASRLCLEITESVLMEESSVGAMHALRDLGVSLSIDDFGTGYSSLGYLKRFPVDSVKVDRSFVDGLGVDSEDSAIVAAVVSLGHALGLSVVAEGVETSGQLRELLALGCDRAQGYWFSGPRDATEFAGLLNNQPWIDGRGSWSS